MIEGYRIEIALDFHGGSDRLPPATYSRHVIVDETADAKAVVELMLADILGWQGKLFPKYYDKADVEVAIRKVDTAVAEADEHALRYADEDVRRGRLLLDLRLGVRAKDELVRSISDRRTKVDGDPEKYVAVRIDPISDYLERLRPQTDEVDFDVRIASASVQLDALIRTIDDDVASGLIVIPEPDSDRCRPRRGIDVFEMREVLHLAIDKSTVPQQDN